MAVSSFIEVYGPINNGAHRQPAELIGAPSLVWHQAFWNPPSGTLDAARRAAEIELYINRVKDRLRSISRDTFSASSSVQVEDKDRSNVITFSFYWHNIRSRLRFEIHIEFLAVTSILDASISPSFEMNDRVFLEFQKRYTEFCRLLCPSASTRDHPPPDDEFLRISKYFYHDVWEKHFQPSVLDFPDLTSSDIIKAKFADLRGFVTCERYPRREEQDSEDLAQDRIERDPLQGCFYRADEGDRGQWQRTSAPDEVWARSRLNQVWPFLVGGVPAQVLDDDAYLYGRVEFTASRLLGGRMLYVSALGPQPREGKGGRQFEQPVCFYLHSVTQCERQIGRVVDRLLQLGTLRLAAIIALPALKDVIPSVETVERDISVARTRTHDLIQYAKCARNVDPVEVKRQETDILGLLGKIQFTMAAVSSGENPNIGQYMGSATLETRLSRSMYYKRMFYSLMPGLRLSRIEGYQVYDEFVERRLGGAFGFIEAVGMRMADIKTQWRALDQLYLTTTVTLLAGDIEGQQSEAKKIQGDIARIQILGESLLLGVLAPYYLTTLTYHIIGCGDKDEDWCRQELAWGWSTKQMIPLVLLVVGILVAYWRAKTVKPRDADTSKG